jgi:crotonobetainyl-CoA:carnitine CoA-transferase CaiB-like acyl-CoA transferase
MLPTIDPDLPLAGVRVLDLTSTIAGPSALRHMADFGAQVIKVESSVRPDGARWSTPHAGGVKGINRSGYYSNFNAGKISMSLNMQIPDAAEVFSRLIRASDVLVEAFVPGVIERWGFGWQQVHAINPRLIMASHCLQGQTGPFAKLRGFGHLAGGMSGWYDLTGFANEDPMGPFSAYTDFLSWPYLFNAILVALELRELTGRGQYIDHAQLESSLHFLAPLLLDLQLNEHLAGRRGNHEDYAAPNNAYRCQGDDRWIAISVSTDAEFAALCGVLGHPEAAADARFVNLDARKAHEAALDELIGGWTAEQEPFELAQRLQAAGVSAGVVAKSQDLAEDPQMLHRGFFRRVEHAEIGPHHVAGQSFLFSDLKAGPVRGGPLLGEHTLDICHEILGLDDEQIATYAATGMFE